MNSFKIFSHTVRSLFKNLSVTFSVLSIPILVAVGPWIAFFIYLVTNFGFGRFPIREVLPFAGSGLLFLVVVFVSILSWIWGAVAWHRFIILDERPAEMAPIILPDRIFAYFGFSLVIAIFAIIFGFLSLILTLPTQNLIWVFQLLADLFANILILTVVIGLATILPSCAANRGIDFSEVVKKSIENHRSLFSLSLVILLLFYVPEILLALFGFYWASFFVNLVSSLALSIFLIALATTLYQVWFEELEL